MDQRPALRSRFAGSLLLGGAISAALCAAVGTADAHPHQDIDQQVLLSVGTGEVTVQIRIAPSFTEGAAIFAHIDTDGDGVASESETRAFGRDVIAGAALTQTTSTVSLEVLSFGRSADVLIILILGGAGRLYGGIVGAIIYMVARDQFSGINPQYWYFWIGLLLVAVVMFLPNGILGGLSALYKKRQ